MVESRYPNGWVRYCSGCQVVQLDDLSHMWGKISEKEWEQFFQEEYGFFCKRCWRTFMKGWDAAYYSICFLENDE